MENIDSIKRTLSKSNCRQNNKLKAQLKSPRDKINCFSVDLEKLKKKQRILPEISSTRRALIDGITEKLRRIKQKIKQKAQQQLLQLNKSQREQSPTIIPINMNYSMPFQIPFSPYGCHFGMHCCSNQCQICNKKKPKKKRKMKKQKKQVPQIKPKKKSRFRICGYVVYFSIFIKYYSQKFTENRRKWFFDRYNRINKCIIDQGTEKFQQKLLQIDLYQLSIQCKNNKHINGVTVVDWQDYTKTALIPNAVSHSQNQRYTVGQFVINLTELFIDRLQQIIFDQEFLKQFHEVFSVGAMDMNFLIDNLYLPEQVPFLFVHPVKGYLRLGYQQEIQLLLMKVFVKMTIYNYLISLHRFKAWNKRLEDKYRLDHSHREQVWELGRVLGVFLYISCKEIYMEGIKNLKHNTNFYQLSRKFGIRQAKSLQQQKFILNQQRQQKQFQLIKNIKDYEIIKQKILKNGRLMQYKDVLKDKLFDILANLHEILKRQQRQLYSYIENMTLISPYIIFQGKNKTNSTKQKQRQRQKQKKQYRILKPANEQRLGREWNKIYGQDNSSLSNERKNTRFNQSISGNQQNDSRLKGADMKNMNSTRINYKNTNNKDRDRANNGEIMRAEQMKKSFNFDIVNSRFDKNRQDRLQQKFRNFLVSDQ